MDKYYFADIKNHIEWNNFVEESPQGTIYSKSDYLKFSGVNFRLLFVYKGNQIKAGVILLLDNDNKRLILDDFIIYGGILFSTDITQKDTKARSERFEITEFIIEELVKSYNNIELSFSPFFEDVRPFLWHNYHSKDKSKKFELDLRYTSFIDISGLINNTDEESSELFKNLDTIRQRNIRKARKENALTIEEKNVSLFVDFYEKMMLINGEAVNKKKLDRLGFLIENLVEINQAKMYLTKNSNNEVIYITVFGIDNKRAYYLFGAGNPKSDENYKGTISFWDSFNILAKKYFVKTVDMEGVNSPKRGWFKLSFGGDLRTYYKLYKRNEE